MELKGTTALITGGGGGIGVGMAQAFAEKGMKLVLADIDLDLAKEQAAEFGETAIAVQLDVTSLDSWKKARAAAEAKFGQIDVLCNNAGIAQPTIPVEEISPELFARVIAINLTGVHNGIITFAGAMKARKSGHIVNTASMHGLLPFGSIGAYTASKFAVTGLSDVLRAELAPFGVGVSTSFPGLTKSRITMSSDIAPDAETLAALLPRMMEPIWIGRAVVRGMEENMPYIISHVSQRAAIEARFQEILDAFGEPAQPGYPG